MASTVVVGGPVTSPFGAGVDPRTALVMELGGPANVDPTRFLEAVPVGTIIDAAVRLVDRFVAGGSSSTFPEGADLRIVSSTKRRSRRKRLLTCQDKADIAFLTGNLGKGQLASSAISSVLSRRC